MPQWVGERGDFVFAFPVVLAQGAMIIEDDDRRESSFCDPSAGEKQDRDGNTG